MYDCIVIGGGVVGTAVLDALSTRGYKTLLIEKEDDVASGASRANSGIAHAGYDCVPGTLKAKFNVEGNKMMPSLTRDLRRRRKTSRARGYGQMSGRILRAPRHRYPFKGTRYPRNQG